MTTVEKKQRRGGIRHIDRLGRLVVPVDIRRQFGWAMYDEVEFFVEGDNVILRCAKPNNRKQEALEKLAYVLENEWDEKLKKTLKETIKLLEGDQL